MTGSLEIISSQLGVPIWAFLIIFLWSIVWKLLAMWKSAKNNSPIWFVILAVVNTIGILEILYIYVFSKMKRPSKPRKKKVVKKKR